MMQTNSETCATLSFTLKPWDSEFFGRKICQLVITGPLNLTELEVALERLDDEGIWGIEVEVKPERMGEVPVLEDAGFRMVDSRMTFISKMTVDDVVDRPIPFGRLRGAKASDMEHVAQLTVDCLVENPLFTSRFKNPRLFSREESIRYYGAWNQRAIDEQPGLFVVWEVNGAVIAYFNYMRADTPEYAPLFKGILTAVDPEYRGHDAHNIMQAWLFRRFGEAEWWIDNTTQISNVAVIRNHIKALKAFKGTSLILYRTSPVSAPLRSQK